MFKSCNKCGELVRVIEDNCIIMCCGQEMTELIPNSVDATAEKHVPQYVVDAQKIEVKVNHGMDDDHYIKWIAIENDNVFMMKELKPNDEAKVVFDYFDNAVIYSYCNKHSLWKNEVK